MELVDKIVNTSVKNSQAGEACHVCREVDHTSAHPGWAVQRRGCHRDLSCGLLWRGCLCPHGEPAHQLYKLLHLKGTLLSWWTVSSQGAFVWHAESCFSLSKKMRAFRLHKAKFHPQVHYRSDKTLPCLAQILHIWLYVFYFNLFNNSIETGNWNL